MSEPVLQLRNVGIRRNDTWMLRDVTWTVRGGEHWVLLGANGSGKTSLLSALGGYITVTTGNIAVLGETFGETDWRILRRKLGIVSSSLRQMMPASEPALYTVASGKDAMIDFWGTPGRSDCARARKILRQLDCEYLALRAWEVLSQGERQRVLIGRALMARPALLVLDEPCAGLDPVARESFLHFVDALARRPGAPSLILVTHHVEEIMPAFSHVALLRQGTLWAAGAKRGILTSAHLSRTFGARIRLERSGAGYRARVRVRGSSAPRRRRAGPNQ